MMKLDTATKELNSHELKATLTAALQACQRRVQNKLVHRSLFRLIAVLQTMHRQFGAFSAALG
jgi:hypothetical protein